MRPLTTDRMEEADERTRAVRWPVADRQLAQVGGQAIRQRAPTAPRSWLPRIGGLRLDGLTRADGWTMDGRASAGQTVARRRADSRGPAAVTKRASPGRSRRC
jgi:hypothetical protein